MGKSAETSKKGNQLIYFYYCSKNMSCTSEMEGSISYLLLLFLLASVINMFRLYYYVVQREQRDIPIAAASDSQNGALESSLMTGDVSGCLHLLK